MCPSVSLSYCLYVPLSFYQVGHSGLLTEPVAGNFRLSLSLLCSVLLSVCPSVFLILCTFVYLSVLPSVLIALCVSVLLNFLSFVILEIYQVGHSGLLTEPVAGNFKTILNFSLSLFLSVYLF